MSSQLMEKISPMLSNAIILLGENLASATSIVSLVLACIVLSYVIALQEFFFSIFRLLRGTTNCLFSSRKSLSDARKATPGVVKNSNLTLHKVCTDKLAYKSKLLRSDVETIMEKLGMYIDSKEDQIQERIGSDEISALFDEAEPSLEEVKEAFGLFDENSDGYIDAKELERVLSALGFVEASELDCKKMILAFDDNGDGRIDLHEFLHLLENSFC